MVKKRLKESAGQELSKEEEEEMKAKTKSSKKKEDLVRLDWESGTCVRATVLSLRSES